MPDEREVFNLDEMIESFDVDRVSVRGPIFDMEKLRWLNGQHLRGLDDLQYAERVKGFLLNEQRLAPLIPLIKERVEVLSDLVPTTDYLVGSIAELNADDFAHKSLDRDEVVRCLHHVSQRLDTQMDWDRDVLMQVCQALAQAMELKFRDFLFPLFVALSGRTVTLPLFDSMSFLGPDLTRVRIRQALESLGMSGKEKKRLDKAYSALQLD